MSPHNGTLANSSLTMRIELFEIKASLVSVTVFEKESRKDRLCKAELGYVLWNN